MAQHGKTQLQKGPPGTARLRGGRARGQKMTAQIFKKQTLPDKAFATLQARAALHGASLHRTHPSDGLVVYFVKRHGLVQLANNIQRVEAMLNCLGAKS
jgi:hypothetical protein